MAFVKAKTNIGAMIGKIEATDVVGVLEALANKLLSKDIVRSPAVRWWLSTGIWNLDLSISRGLGLPAGKIIEIFGPPRASKTTLCLEIGKQAQLQGGLVIWLDFETSMSLQLAVEMQEISTAPSSWYYFQPDEVEAAFNFAEAMIRKWPSMWEGREVPPIVFVLDSVAACVAAGERDKGMNDAVKVAEMAAHLSRFLPKILVYLAKTNAYFICVNQFRAKVDTSKPGQGGGGLRSNSSNTAGGLALEYYSRVRLALSPDEIYMDETASGTKNPDQAFGMLVRCKLDKNGVDTPYRACCYAMYFRDDQFRRGIDDGMSCIIYLISRKAIKTSGNGWYWLVEGGKKYTKAALHVAFYEDPDTRTSIQQMVAGLWCEEHKVTEDKFWGATGVKPALRAAVAGIEGQGALNANSPTPEESAAQEAIQGCLERVETSGKAQAKPQKPAKPKKPKAEKPQAK